MNVRRNGFLTTLVLVSTTVVVLVYWRFFERWDLQSFSMISNGSLDLSHPANETYIFDVVLKRNRASGTHIVAVCTYASRFITLNWIASLVRNNYTKFVVFCHDRPTWAFLSARGYQHNSVILPARWSTAPPRAFSPFKMLYEIISRDLSFLYCDTGSVFLSSSIVEHVQFSQQFSDGDMAFAVFKRSHRIVYNTGFFYVIPTRLSKEIFKKLAEVDSADSSTSVNELIDEARRERKFATLDHFLYASSLAATDEGNATRPALNIKPVFVQANSFADLDQKQEFLRSNGYWFV
jgi:hypothetical protein